DLSQKTSFRKSDQFALMANEKNNMTERLSGLVTESREDLTAVKHGCEDLKALLKAMDDSGLDKRVLNGGNKEKGERSDVETEVAERLSELSRLVEEMNSRVSKIKTS
ncbi:MAG: hypothetical protein ACE5DR_04395, partial [Thermodesulfobacteriota bacterium]